MEPVIPRRIAPSPEPAPLEPADVRREFRARSDGGRKLRPAGEARHDPKRLLTPAYTPSYKLELFDAVFYLADVRQNDTIRFFVAYVVIGADGPGPAGIYPRIFYKDGSLIWRSASHFISYGEDASTAWIGKGDVETVLSRDYESVVTLEHTTDLPLELQAPLEELSRRPQRIPRDDVALGLVLRQGPKGRIEAYRDFTEPRRRARANPRNRVNGGRRIARFTRRNDPSSLRFVAGFEPDFRSGVLEVSASGSRLYGGRISAFGSVRATSRRSTCSMPARTTCGSRIPRRRRPSSPASACARSMSPSTTTCVSPAWSTTTSSTTILPCS
jgi:hypothetical protein